MNAPINSIRRDATTAVHRLALFGATRGIGRSVLEQALESGHTVTALVRDPSSFAFDHPRLEVIEGDATNAVDVERTIRGADAVLCGLGASALSRSKVRSESARHIVNAMERRGVRRLICVSVLGAHESRAGLPFFLRYVFFPIYLRRAVADHEAQEQIIRDSGVDWTIVRPPFLKDGPQTGDYAHGFDNDEVGLTLDVSRADVADFMLHQIASADYVGRAAGISYRKAAAR